VANTQLVKAITFQLFHELLKTVMKT